MAKGPTKAKPERPTHTVAEKHQDIAQLRRRIAELEAFDPTVITNRHSDPTVTKMQAAIERTITAIFGHGTTDYRRYAGAVRLDQGPAILRGGFGGGITMIAATRFNISPREKLGR